MPRSFYDWSSPIDGSRIGKTNVCSGRFDYESNCRRRSPDNWLALRRGAEHSAEGIRLLQQSPTASLIGQRCSRFSRDAEDRTHRSDTNPLRAPSSIRPAWVLSRDSQFRRNRTPASYAVFALLELRRSTRRAKSGALTRSRHGGRVVCD